MATLSHLGENGRFQASLSLTGHARMTLEIAKFLSGGLRAAVALLGSLKSIICPQVAEPKDFTQTILVKMLIPLDRQGEGIPQNSALCRRDGVMPKCS